jgi:hypothetical protein
LFDIEFDERIKRFERCGEKRAFSMQIFVDDPRPAFGPQINADSGVNVVREANQVSGRRVKISWWKLSIRSAVEDLVSRVPNVSVLQHGMFNGDQIDERDCVAAIRVSRKFAQPIFTDPSSFPVRTVECPR